MKICRLQVLKPIVRLDYGASITNITLEDDCVVVTSDNPGPKVSRM